MRILVIQNYPGTPLGAVGRALDEAGIGTRLVAAYDGEPVPERLSDEIGLVVLGGAQSALADAEYPFLPAVCDLIRTAHDQDTPILGICLGAQLIARAFGGQNVLDRPVEFGWQHVNATPAGRSDPVIGAIGAGAPLFHWHTDTVELPPGAVHLASSADTPNQAFRLGRATYATQFHFEVAEPEARQWSSSFADVIARHTPDWPLRLDEEAARHAPDADRAGLSLARRWVQLLRD